MPTIEQHWAIVQANMDAIKRILDNMDGILQRESTAWEQMLDETIKIGKRRQDDEKNTD